MERVYRFGPFDLDTASTELRRSGARVRLAGKSRQALELLLERKGTVVSREELRDRLWGADTFVDFEDGLNHVIRRIREALEHDPRDPKFIETVPGVGYRFTGSVQTVSPGGSLLEERPPQVPPRAESAPTSVPPSAPSRQMYAWMTLTTALAILLVGLLVWPTAGGRASGALVTRMSFPLPSPLPGPAENFQVALSPDGRSIAFSAEHLYLRRLDQLEPERIEGTAPARDPFFSPDSRWVGFVLGSGLARVPTTGGAPIAAGRIGGQGGASWSPSGTIVFAPNRTTGGLKQLLPDQAEPVVLIEPDLEKGDYVHRWPQVLPGEEAVVFTAGHAGMESWDDASIAVLQRATGQLHVILEGGSRARYVSTGHLLYVRGGSLLAVPFDLGGLTLTGTPTPVVENVYGHAGFDVSEEGALLYAVGEDGGEKRRILLVDRQGTTLRVVAEGQEFIHPRFSPDGQRLAFSTGGLTPDIRILDLDRGTLTAVTTRWHNAWPRWTPDGHHVDFQSSRSGDWNSHRRLADGSGPIEHLLATEHLSFRVAAADGVLLTYESTYPAQGANWDIRLRTPDTGALVRSFLATAANESWPELSPDGTWVAYESDESGQKEVYLRRFPEGEGQWSVSIGGGRFVRWSRNGREVFYLDDDRVMAVDVREDDGLPVLGTPRLLFERPISNAVLGRNYDVAPDGQTFAIVDPGEPPPTPDHLVLVQNFDEELKRLAPPES